MLNKMRKNANEKGFTLIELMIVIAIIGILAAIAVPNFIAFRDKGFCSAAESDARSIGAALADYFSVPTRTQFTDLDSVDHVLTFTDFNVLKLSNLNEATIEMDDSSGINHYIITVDESGTSRCPEEYRDANPRWNDTYEYSYTI